MAYEPVRKRQRVSHACDFCHVRGIKCHQPMGDPQGPQAPGCLTCTSYGVECTTNRHILRRGRKPKDAGFRSLDTVRRLVRIYRDTMYQCYFPFLPENDLEVRWEKGIPDAYEPSYLLLMALCAVSCQTAAQNAVFDHALLEGICMPASDQYFSEAVSKIPSRIPQSSDLDYLRSFGLLAVYSLQRGNHSDLQHYLGLYHAMVARHGFHDETRWPDISMAEADDRRRLFWCVYRLEIHSACVLGHVVRLPEAQVSVLYPRITPAMDRETQAWTNGWDYITDLFRLLEYSICSLRSCKNRKPALSKFHSRPEDTRMLLDSLIQLKTDKPRTLVGLAEPGSGLESNRCKYMAVQIVCTETLVHIMALLYCQAPAREVVDIAEDFLGQVSGAPLIFFKVASSHIVHQLLGVGHMLLSASRYDSDQCQSEVKRLVAFLGDLIKNLEHDIPSAAEAGERLLRLSAEDV